MPRAFAPGDVDLLADLAEEATDRFELRRRMADDGGTVASRVALARSVDPLLPGVSAPPSASAFAVDPTG